MQWNITRFNSHWAILLRQQICRLSTLLKLLIGVDLSKHAQHRQIADIQHANEDVQGDKAHRVNNAAGDNRSKRVGEAVGDIRYRIDRAIDGDMSSIHLKK